MFTTQMPLARAVRRPAAAVVAVTLLFTTACGDDDDERAETEVIDSSDTTDPAGSDDSAPPAEDGDDTETSDVGDESGALLLIMDSSGSMNSRGDNGERLIDLAKGSLRAVVENLPDEKHVGLRVYGHRYSNTDEENGCQDTELIHPVEALDRPGLLESIDGYDAQGFTPIGLSLSEGAKDLPPEGKRSIILVSDGQETCDSDPCQAAEDLAEEGIDVVVHTVGFVLDLAAPDEADQARDELACIADATGGSFVDVEDTEDLADAIEDVAREERGLDSDGGSLEGSPVPRDAATGNINTSYTDTVLGVETNYYRFEIDPGSEVVAELTRMGNPDTSAQCQQVHVTDLGGEQLATAGVRGGAGGEIAGDVAQTEHTDPVRVNADEVWLQIETMACGAGPGHPDAEFDVQLRLTVD